MGTPLRDWKCGSYDSEGRPNSTLSKSPAKTGNEMPSANNGGMKSMPKNAADSGRRNKG